MTVQVITERAVFLAGYRLTSQLRGNSEARSIAELDATVYGGDTMLNEPGLKGYGLSGEGFWDGAAIDAPIHDRLRTRNVVHTLCLTDASIGSPARSLQSMIAEYQIGSASVGELLPVTYTLGAMAAPVLGNVLHNAESTGNVTGTAVQLGAISASQFLYGALHVFSGTGGFIVKIQSATDEAFTTPNDRITFATVLTGTPQASEWATPVAGAITDTWWRITATNPNTRDFAVVAAIQ